MSPFKFNWDRGNMRKLTKHLVGLDEAESVFMDERKIVRYDWKHSAEELRYFCIAESSRNRILL